MMRTLSEENARMRGLTGQGQPGLNKLLGGGVLETDAAQQYALSGRGVTGAVSTVDPAYVDQRLKGPGTVVGGGGGSGGGGGVYFPPNRPPNQVAK